MKPEFIPENPHQCLCLIESYSCRCSDKKRISGNTWRECSTATLKSVVKWLEGYCEDNSHRKYRKYTSQRADCLRCRKQLHNAAEGE